MAAIGFDFSRLMVYHICCNFLILYSHSVHLSCLPD